MSRTTSLQGEPGCGKSHMALLTAMRPPVYVTDIDNKVAAAAWAAPGLKDGSIILWELKTPVDKTNMASRLHTLTSDITKVGPSVRPQGVTLWAEQIYRLPEIHKVTPFGTLLVDSLTLLNEHVKAMIMYDAKRSKFTFDQWTALKIFWMDTFSFLRDLCRENNWDLIVTVHERIKEEPGDRTTGVRVEADAQGNQQRTFVGTQDVKVWASIDGAFGDLIGAQCDEYYHLYVDATDKEHPKWRCRVHPDGRRSLRTSFKLASAVHDPDFRSIWK